MAFQYKSPYFFLASSVKLRNKRPPSFSETTGDGEDQKVSIFINGKTIQKGFPGFISIITNYLI